MEGVKKREGTLYKENFPSEVQFGGSHPMGQLGGGVNSVGGVLFSLVAKPTKVVLGAFQFGCLLGEVPLY